MPARGAFPRIPRLSAAGGITEPLRRSHLCSATMTAMTSSIHLRTAPFVLAIAVAIGLVLSAPFVSQIRNAIRAHFPGHFVLVVGILGGGLLLLALASAV